MKNDELIEILDGLIEKGLVEKNIVDGHETYKLTSIGKKVSNNINEKDNSKRN